MRDVLEVRRALEELAIQLACVRIEDSEIKELESACTEFKKAAQTKELMAIAGADEKFHDIIYEATRNQRLIQILNNLREQMYRYRLEYIKQGDKHPIIIQEHEQIVQAVKRRLAEEATLIIRKHIDNQELTVTHKIIKEQ